MKVLIVSGIWPPDVGGPASHSPELAAWLHGGGHRVEVLTTATAAPTVEAYPVHWIGRGLPPGTRHAAFALRLALLARATDVVYVNSVLTRGVSGARVARKPVVVKLTDDPAYERARRFGLFAGDLDGFQRFDGGPRVRALRALRDAALRGASLVVCPSAYLREHALGWGLRPERVVVVENATPELPDLPTREEARADFDIDGPLLAFAGRLGPAKALEVTLAALAELADVTLLLAGDGPGRASLERQAAELGLGERVRFLGALGRDEVLRLFRAADAAVLSSAWENFPHTLVEALAVGTPVVATVVGGVPEIVRDGENGLLVLPGDPAALAAALRRYLGDAHLQQRLCAGAAASVEHLRPERVYGRLEALLTQVASSR
ncbi:MAG: glycosyltransferase family 4 protein [Gaiellaceae bacterium MAG52_C11]|nr:glycosyltransferase family 4 protein [Candidatus Gaiellasilicea maunaloa]